MHCSGLPDLEPPPVTLPDFDISQSVEITIFFFLVGRLGRLGSHNVMFAYVRMRARTRAHGKHVGNPSRPSNQAQICHFCFPKAFRQPSNLEGLAPQPQPPPDLTVFDGVYPVPLKSAR